MSAKKRRAAKVSAKVKLGKNSAALERASKELGEIRGRALFYDSISTGRGNGAYLELLDGSVKIDFITGIGVNFFGHSDPRLIKAAVEAAGKDPFQGNLVSDLTLLDFSRALLKKTPKKAGLVHAFISNSGAMANENALKILRSADPHRPGIIAFKDCFHGRTQTLAEVTDNPAIRPGLPVGDWIRYLPFYDPASGATTARIVDRLRELTNYNRAGAIVMELVQGEGGFRSAPREFFRSIARTAREAGIKVWIDEVQTVGRTDSFFAFESMGLAEYVDVVTAGKLIQCGATLFRSELNPAPGLLSQTFAGATVPLAVGTKMIELLSKGRYYGAQGSNRRLTDRIIAGLERIAEDYPEKISMVGGYDGMIAFQFEDGSRDATIAAVRGLFEDGLMVFYCGHGPYKIRMLPPLGALTSGTIDEALRIVKKYVKRLVS